MNIEEEVNVPINIADIDDFEYIFDGEIPPTQMPTVDANNGEVSLDLQEISEVSLYNKMIISVA